MNPHELLTVAAAAGLPNPHVVPWKHHARKTSLQLLWGETDRRWSLLVPSNSTAADVASLFRVQAMPDDTSAETVPVLPEIEHEAETYAPVHAAEPPPLPPADEDFRPLEPRPVTTRRRQAWGIKDLLARAAPAAPKEELPPQAELPPAKHFPPDLDDTMRRRAAKVAVMNAVEAVSNDLARMQPRYELALQAHNGNVQVIEMMEEEAKTLRLSVKALAERIIIEQRAAARRMMQCHAEKAKALAALDAASGEDIGRVEQNAIRQIRGA